MEGRRRFGAYRVGGRRRPIRGRTARRAVTRDAPAVARGRLLGMRPPSRAGGRMAALALTTLRVVLAPALLWITRDGRAGAWYVVCCLVALGSDIVDGIIARRAGVD